MTSSRTEELEFEIWLQNGVDRGWVSEPFCCTHDGGPLTEEEEQEFDEFGEACIGHVKLLL